MTSLSELVQWRRVPERALALYREIESQAEDVWQKQAYSPALQRFAEAINLLPGEYPGGIPNHPGPLASMLAGGLAGAGLGYGVGAVGEAVLPASWKRRKLKRTLALLGGLAGTTPGLAYGGLNKADGRPFNDNSLLQKYEAPKTAEHKEIVAAVEKSAAWGPTGAFYAPPIDVNEFNQIVWKDPRVAKPLSPPLQAAATGLITGAANLPGKRNTRWVTPVDIGRMAAGMGSGYLSGALVGKALGTMMGMPPSTQDRLKSTGMWAGLVANLVPKVFGAR